MVTRDKDHRSWQVSCRCTLVKRDGLGQGDKKFRAINSITGLFPQSMAEFHKSIVSFC